VTQTVVVEQETTTVINWQRNAAHCLQCLQPRGTAMIIIKGEEAGHYMPMRLAEQWHNGLSANTRMTAGNGLLSSMIVRAVMHMMHPPHTLTIYVRFKHAGRIKNWDCDCKQQGSSVRSTQYVVRST
jgi:hypothetical protein